MMHPKFWTKEEDDFLKEFGAFKSLKELEALLPNRTINAIGIRLSNLGIKSKVRSWSQEEIDILHKLGSLYNHTELSEFIPLKTPLSIRKKKVELGIRLNKEQRQIRNCNLDFNFTFDDLDNTVKQILIGCMFGDGSCCCNFKKSKNNAIKLFRFQVEHGIDQKDFLIWKSQKLDIFKGNVNRIDYKPVYESCKHPIFTFLRHKFYPYDDRPSEKTLLPLDILEQMDLFGLLVYYLNDGSSGLHLNKDVNRYYFRPKITAKRFGFEGRQKVVEVINKKLGLNLIAQKQEAIYIPMGDFRYLTPIWEEYFKTYNIPECMIYKLGQ